MSRILESRFFNRPTLAVAHGLLGKYLCRRRGRRIIRAMITEVEAYDGPRDKASHASRGRTVRNTPMFGPAGHWYVYLTYGMHWMANIVVGKRGYPAAVLIRGVEGINGPARVTKYFKIDKRFNSKPAARQTGLWIEERGVRIKRSDIKHSARIGIAYAGPVWSNRRYRFHLN
ncbi:MAG: DNA-3-methyladenine glycosylase [Patescibacteria group bacterium]